jgi:glycosyltransferase involved in cell wall biosynthesis
MGTNSDISTKIVVVSHDAHLDGAPLLILHVAQVLKREFGMEVTTILLGDGPLRSEFEKIGPLVDFTRPHWRSAMSKTVANARTSQLRQVRTAGYGHAICNTTVSGALIPLLHENGFKTLMLVHELPILLKQLNLTEVAAAAAGLADRVVFPATFVKDRFNEVAAVEEGRSAIRPQGLYRANPFRNNRAPARERLAKLIGLEGNAPIVVGAGPADRRKGIDIFCQVASLVVRDVPEARFVWLGDDDKDLARDCKAWLDVLGLSSKVHFLGLVKDPEVYASHVAAANVFLMTSREDPFPSVVLEAMAVGIPVVGFQDAGGFADLLAQGTGLLVPYEDRATMVDAILSLIRQPAQAKAMGETGQRIIDAQFQFRDYVYDLLRLAGIFRPKVSVVIPNYNYARYLPARIASILQQTYRPYEIIFLDDRSTDDSVKVVRELLAKSDIPYRIVENEVNRGCYAQWLAGIGLCRGDLVWIAEADDTCEPRLLEKLVPGFRDHDVVLAYCQSRRIDGNGNVVTPDYLDHTDAISSTKWRSSYVRKGLDEIRDTLAIKNTIPNASAVLMRRPSLAAIKDRLTQHKNAGDWLTYVHLLEGGSIYFCPEVLNSHRVHGHGLTQGGNTARHFTEILMVQEYIRQRHPLSDETLRKVEDMRQRTFAYLGLKSEATPEYWQHPAAAEVLRQVHSAADEPATSLG